MNKRVSALTILAAIGLSFIAATPAQAGNIDHKIEICHANEGSKGYTNPTVDYDSIVNLKDGTVVKNGHAVHQDGRDIIPAFNWIDNGVRYYFDGQNLDKADLLANGCVEPAVPGVVTPVPPTYTPATCLDPKAKDNPFGTVNVPAELGEGIKSASTPTLNADNTVWNVTYTLKDSNEEFTYAWPANETGVYNFTVVPLSADKNWVVDSKTGVGSCELPDTGAAQDILLYGGIGAGVLLIGATLMGANKLARRRA